MTHVIRSLLRGLLTPESPVVRVIGAAIVATLLGALVFSAPTDLIWQGLLVALLAAGFAASIRAYLDRRVQVIPPPLPAIDGLAVPLMHFDVAGDLVAANQEARALLGIGDGLPRVADLFVDLGRPVRDWIADVAAGRLPSGAEVLAQRGAVDRFVQVSLRADGQGGALAALQDATAVKRLEVQLSQGQKMQAIGQLAGGIAHDFNNLLTAITGHCDLLLLRHSEGDADHPDLIQIRQNSNRAAALVAQLLAFSRKQTLHAERLDVQEILSDLAHLLNRLLGERVRLDLLHTPEPVALRADRRQLEQVILNLAVNARDAMPDGGVVEISTRIVRLDHEVQRDRAIIPRGAHVVIRVADTGIGIPPERIGKIFDPFYTTKRAGEGTGLGLATAYGIVKQSGGFIFVDSTPGVGTVFELWFPLCHEMPLPVARPVERRTRAGHGAVLLVEDEAPVRAFAARALRLHGHSVVEAASAEEALALLENRDLGVDVFVTDVVMPGMDGPAWVQIAQEARPLVRTVFMSGYAEESLADAQTRVPNSVFLPKPFSLRDLIDTVQGQLAADRAAPPSAPARAPPELTTAVGQGNGRRVS